MVVTTSPIDLVVFSSVHWHFTWQRHQELSSRLAGRGYRVRFVEPIPKRWPGLGEASRVFGRLTGRHDRAGLVRQSLSSGVELANPLLLPDVGPVSRRLNRQLFGRRAGRSLAAGLGRPRIVLHYLPLAAAIDLQRALDPDLAVYDCVWDWTNDPYSRPGVTREEALLANVDTVFADSPHLFGRMCERHREVHRVLPAVDWGLYAPARVVASGGRTRATGGELRCAYFGAIGVNLDLALVRRLSREFSLRLIGPIQSELGDLGARTELTGPVPRAEVPGLLADADVLVLPYGKEGHARGIIPAKTFECLATGKPIVACGLPSLEEYSEHFRLVADADGFVAAVRTALDEPSENRERRLALARANSWELRADEIDGILRAALAKRSRS